MTAGLIPSVRLDSIARIATEHALRRPYNEQGSQGKFRTETV
jgi:hypothetical protein